MAVGQRDSPFSAFLDTPNFVLIAGSKYSLVLFLSIIDSQGKLDTWDYPSQPLHLQTKKTAPGGKVPAFRGLGSDL